MSQAQAAAGESLPRAVTERLLADSDAMARRMTRRLADEIPLGGDFRSLGYLRLVVTACRDGLRALLRQLHDGRRANAAELAVLGAAGARQAEMGVPLDMLLSGYRLAAKVVWREVVDEAVRLGELSPPTVVVLSEQVLEYLDGISGAVGSAYLETRERLMRQRDRDRDRLLQRLLAGDTSDDLRRHAVAAGLELQPPYRVLAIATTAGDADRRLTAAWRRHRLVLGPEEFGGGWVVLVNPAVTVARLHAEGSAACDGVLQLGVGPVAEQLEEVASAAQAARGALIAGRRIHPDGALFDHTEMGPYAAVAERPEQLRAFVDRALGPLLQPPRPELLATLEAVLTTRGAAETATRLGVHRHTVVYRLARITELLARDLDDPEERHRLWLALRLQRLV